MKRHSYKLEPWQGMNFALDADSDVRTEKCDSTKSSSIMIKSSDSGPSQSESAAAAPEL